MASSWDELETKLYDTLIAIKTPIPGPNPGDPPGAPLAVLGNVHRHQPEHEQSSRLAAYYLADVGGKRPEARAWSVFVTPRLDFDSVNTTEIPLTADIHAWYDKGVNGSGVMLLKQHMSVYQQELRKLGRRMGGTVSIILNWGQVAYESVPIPVDSGEGEAIRGRFRIEALRGMGRI